MTLVEDRFCDADDDARTLEQVVVLRRFAASRTAGSQMRRLIEHLLKFEYARRPNLRSGWRRTVLDAHIEVQGDLTPTLRRDLDSELQDLFAAARDQAAEALQTHDEPRAAGTLRNSRPYGIAELLDRHRLPDNRYGLLDT